MRLITGLLNDKHAMAKSNPKRQYGRTTIAQDDYILRWFCTIISAANKQTAQSAFLSKKYLDQRQHMQQVAKTSIFSLQFHSSKIVFTTLQCTA